MIFFNWVLTVLAVAVIAMWIIELRRIFKGEDEQRHSEHQRSETKSDGSGRFRPTYRAMGQRDDKASSSTQDHAPRRGAGIKSNTSGSARSSQALVKPLQNKEGVTQ